MTVAMLTPEQIAQRTHRAVDTTVRAGRQLGLEITEPNIMYEATGLAPSPEHWRTTPLAGGLC
jgi:hypothetical protein